MSYIDKINRDGTDYDIQDSKAARSVEGTTASHVLQANEIYTATTQTQFEEFIFRTTGGDASLETGNAIIEAIFGGISKDTSVPHTPESTTVTGTFANEETTVEINKDTWRGKVTTSGDYEFSYNGSNWQLSGSNVTLSQYGLTVSGTVTSGDTIVVAYARLSTGALTVATPTSFVSTGFNQYDATAGYAHVVGGNQYRIAGTYTSLTFSETPTGSTSAVTVTNNRFVPEEDGYIHVVGGSGNILIALVWSGTMDNEPYSAYEESTITVPTKDAENNDLPTATYGLPGIGNIRDSISFTDKVYTQRIARLPYTIANLEMLEGVGAEYGTTMIYDASYIYYALQQPVVYQLAESTTDTYTANDFGTEEFRGTTVPIYTGLRYGNSLVDKLRNLVDIQEVGDGLEMDGSTIKTAHELNDDVPTGFFSGEAQVNGEGTNIELDGTMAAKLADVQLNGDTLQGNKNIFNTAMISYYPTNGDMTVTKTNSSITMEATGTVGSQLAQIAIHVPDKTKTYTISGIAKKLSGSKVLHIRKRATDNVSSWGNYVSIFAQYSPTIGREYSFSHTFTGSEFYEFTFYNYDGADVVVGEKSTYYNLQIEESTSPTAFVEPQVPSLSSPVPIYTATGAQNIMVVGKNLLPIYDGRASINELTVTVKDGVITINGTPSSSCWVKLTNGVVGSATQDANWLSEKTPITNFKNKTISFKYLSGIAPGSSWAMRIYDNSDTYIQQWRTGATDSDATWSTDTDQISYFALYVNKGYAFYDYKIKIQVEDNLEKTDFSQFHGGIFPIDLGNIELCNLYRYQDSIYKNGSDWYLHKEVGKTTFTGTEDWARHNHHNGIFSFSYATAGAAHSDSAIMCSTLATVYVTYYNSEIGRDYGQIATLEKVTNSTTSSVFITAPNSSIETLPQFTAWLTENPTTAYFAIPFTTTKITDETLLGQLNALADAMGADEKTNITISATGTNLASPLTVSAYRKTLAGVVANL